MGDKPWKQLERDVALILGGVRSWDSKDSIDVLVPEENPEWAVECKNLSSPTVADLERILIHNQAKADGRGIRSALVVKRKAGRGRPTPMLLVLDLGLFFAPTVDNSVNDERNNAT